MKFKIYKPSKYLTLDNATYVCPYSKTLLPISTSAISILIPCDLWTVIHHANLSGICERYMKPFFISSYSNKFGNSLNNKLLNQKRLKMFKSIMKFMEVRVDLDLQGWEEIDIFAHK